MSEWFEYATSEAFNAFAGFIRDNTSGVRNPHACEFFLFGSERNLRLAHNG